MLFPEEHSGLLKAWIVKRLENTSDADADVLADYVLALLRHDGSPEEVRSLCQAEIADFLQDDTPVFLDNVFAAISYQSYLPGAAPAPARPPKPAVMQPSSVAVCLPAAVPTLPAHSGAIPTAPRYPTASISAAVPPFNNQQTNPRKRPFQARGDGDGQSANERGFGPGPGRPLKQPRHFGGPGGPGGSGAGPSYQGPKSGTYPAPAGHGALPVGLAGMSISCPMGHMPEMNPHLPGMQMMDTDMTGAIPPPLQPGGMRGPMPKRRQRCRDYERQGFCARGISCVFEHGPPVSSYMSPMPLAPQASLDGYDPTTAALVLPSSNGHMTLPGPSPFSPNSRPGMQPNDNNSNNRQGRPFKKGRGGRSQLSAEGPVHDRSRTAIVVENIPEGKFTESEVRGFFSQFGNIEEISMQPYKRLAVVKYDKWHSANAAWRSPKVVFDNRFVRIFWFNGDNASLAGGATPQTAGNGDSSSDKPAADGPPAKGQRRDTANGRPAGDADLDMDEFARKQKEAQKAFEEKKRRKEEVDRMRQEVEQRQKDLLARQEEEKQKLLAKIAAATSSKAEAGKRDKATGGDSPSPEITFSRPSGATPSAKTPGESSQTESLRAKLAALEAEAKSMGLDPEAITEESAEPWATPSYRGGGGFRGRGRGGFRASGYPPRGFRGGFRGGRGGGAGGGHAAYSAYSIDNRPRKVAITGVDFTEPEKDEKLRQYLLGIGEFTEIQTTAAVTQITFADRRTAESFVYGQVGTGKSVPGVDGQVDLAWVPNSSGPTSGGVPASVDSTPASNGVGSGKAAAAAADEDTVMTSTRDDEPAANNADYDDEVPADDQDWDVA